MRRRMKRQARRDTKPELELRSILHRRGLRYRVDRRVIRAVRSRADLVFGPTRVAVFVDGCFWHACPWHGTLPRKNGAWWREKLAGNRVRDRRTDRILREAGWVVIRVWEHQDMEKAATRVETVVRGRR